MPKQKKKNEIGKEKGKSKSNPWLIEHVPFSFLI
jgi:hypothetical protein